jgi:hypothetical protein
MAPAAAFDRRFLFGIADHKQDIEEYMLASRTADTAVVRDFARRTLPVLRTTTPVPRGLPRTVAVLEVAEVAGSGLENACQMASLPKRAKRPARERVGSNTGPGATLEGRIRARARGRGVAPVPAAPLVPWFRIKQ